MTRAAILMYHNIGYPSSPGEIRYACTPEKFATQMRYLDKSPYRLIGLDELIQRLDTDENSDDICVAVTFDDGFADLHKYAMSVLCKFNIPATVFMVSGRMGGSNEWMRRDRYAERTLLSKDQLRDLSDNGICIGSHSRTHARLTQLDEHELEQEVRLSKSVLEDALRRPVDYFAYPFGAYSDSVKRSVRQAGYLAACSTRSGFSATDIDRFALRRIEITGSDTFWQFKQKIKFGTNDKALSVSLRYYARRIFGSRETPG